MSCYHPTVWTPIHAGRGPGQLVCLDPSWVQCLQFHIQNCHVFSTSPKRHPPFLAWCLQPSKARPLPSLPIILLLVYVPAIFSVLLSSTPFKNCPGPGSHVRPTAHSESGSWIGDGTESKKGNPSSLLWVSHPDGLFMPCCPFCVSLLKKLWLVLL